LEGLVGVESEGLVGVELGGLVGVAKVKQQNCRLHVLTTFSTELKDAA
jgi:hypothetical protein